MGPQSKHPIDISFEFFPPKTEEGLTKLRKARDELTRLKPLYFSVTFGAGGSTRQGTFEMVVEIRQQTGVDAAPHLSCVGSTRENIRSILEAYRERGIDRIVALRGDMPSGMGEAGEFRYASELVQFIRSETGDHFHIEVAAYPEVHPQAPSAAIDLLNFKHKVEAGADGALTQYFYNTDGYFYFIDRCRKIGIDVPIVPGIMPITNCRQLVRFSESCGAGIPRWIHKHLEGFGEDMESLRAFGLDVTTNLCRKLIDGGAPGLHFYSMNQAGPSMQICENLGITA